MGGATVWLAGQEMVGAWVSLTVTVNVQVEALFAASAARKETDVTPTGKTAPEAGPAIWVMVGLAGQLSVAVAAAKLTLAEHRPSVLGWVMLVGQVMLGGVMSAAVTLSVKLPVAAPAPSTTI